MRVLWITAVVILLDQLSKIAVLQYMDRHESIPVVGDWFQLTFTENPGMAFGIQVGPEGTVTILAFVATLLVAYYLFYVRGGYWPYRASLALILGGAIGNIIDRTFYGVWLSYGELFTGRVVDFIHVSVWEGFLPNALPLVGGAYMELFPIWNVADMAIVGGVVGILLFQDRFHRQLEASRASASPGADGTQENGQPTDNGIPPKPDSPSDAAADGEVSSVSSSSAST